MESSSRQTGKGEFFARTPEFEPLKGLRNPESDIWLLGESSISKKNPTIMQDLSRRCIATSGESMSTYPRRPKAEALSNAVDVFERLRDPTDQLPNARHLRDLHMFSLVMSLELLIQLRPRESFVSTTAW